MRVGFQRDDDRVFENDVFVQVVVVQYAGVQELQEQVYCVRVGLFYLVKNKDAAGGFFNKTGERPRLGFFVAGSETDQADVRLVIGEATHVEPLAGDRQSLGRLFGQEGFAYARRPCKHKDGARAPAPGIGLSQDFGAEHSLGKGMHYVILPVHLFEQDPAHVADAARQFRQFQEAQKHMFGMYTLILQERGFGPRPRKYKKQVL